MDQRCLTIASSGAREANFVWFIGAPLAPADVKR